MKRKSKISASVHIIRVPILSEGRLAGIVSRRDIIKFVLELRYADKRLE